MKKRNHIITLLTVFCILFLGVWNLAEAEELPSCLQFAMTKWSSIPVSRNTVAERGGEVFIAIKSTKGNLALIKVKSGDNWLIDTLDLYKPTGILGPSSSGSSTTVPLGKIYTGDKILSKTHQTLKSSFMLDVDTGKMTTSTDADIWLKGISISGEQLKPVNGAQIFFCPPQQDSRARNGASCRNNSQCDSNYCADNFRCAPIDYSGQKDQYCHHDNHCSSKRCSCNNGMRERNSFCTDWKNGASGKCLARRPNGSDCTDDYNCESGYCADNGKVRSLDWWPNRGGRCAPHDGTGKPNTVGGNYCHHNNHCKNGNCICPPGAGPNFWGFCSDWEDADVQAQMRLGFFRCP